MYHSKSACSLLPPSISTSIPGAPTELWKLLWGHPPFPFLYAPLLGAWPLPTFLLQKHHMALLIFFSSTCFCHFIQVKLLTLSQVFYLQLFPALISLKGLRSPWRKWGPNSAPCPLLPSKVRSPSLTPHFRAVILSPEPALSKFVPPCRTLFQGPRLKKMDSSIFSWTLPFSNLFFNVHKKTTL